MILSPKKNATGNRKGDKKKLFNIRWKTRLIILNRISNYKAFEGQ